MQTRIHTLGINADAHTQGHGIRMCMNAGVRAHTQTHTGRDAAADPAAQTRVICNNSSPERNTKCKADHRELFIAGWIKE